MLTIYVHNNVDCLSYCGMKLYDDKPTKQLMAGITKVGRLPFNWLKVVSEDKYYKGNKINCFGSWWFIQNIKVLWYDKII